MNPRLMRNAIVYVLIIGVVLVLFLTFFQGPRGASEASISSVVEQAKAGGLAKIEVAGDKLTVTTKSGDTFTSRKEEGSSLVEILDKAAVQTGAGGLQVVVKGRGGMGSLFSVLISFLPIIFVGALLLFMMRQAQGSSAQTLNFGRSRARMIMANRPTVTFADVAGVEEAKQELQEVVEFLRYPEAWGPPACGTSLTRPSATPPASCSLTRLTPWDATAARAWEGATMSGSRPSTRSWWRWMALTPTPTSSSLPPPTAPTFWTRPCCAQAGSTAG
jgi:hypothetical protein